MHKPHVRREWTRKCFQLPEWTKTFRGSSWRCSSSRRRTRPRGSGTGTFLDKAAAASGWASLRALSSTRDPRRSARHRPTIVGGRPPRSALRGSRFSGRIAPARRGRPRTPLLFSKSPSSWYTWPQVRDDTRAKFRFFSLFAFVSTSLQVLSKNYNFISVRMTWISAYLKWKEVGMSPDNLNIEAPHRICGGTNSKVIIYISYTTSFLIVN